MLPDCGFRYYVVTDLTVVLGIVLLLISKSVFTNLSLLLFIDSVSSKCVFRCLACCLKCSQFAFDNFHRDAYSGLVYLYLVLSVVYWKVIALHELVVYVPIMCCSYIDGC